MGLVPLLVEGDLEGTPLLGIEGDRRVVHSPRASDGLVGHYLREIGKIPLLTAAQEVEIGRRIEAGQIAMREALAGIPSAVRGLLEVGDRLRRGEIPAEEVILLPDGRDLEPRVLRKVVRALAHVRRLEAGRERGTRGPWYRRMAKILAGIPFTPTLIETIVAEVRRQREAGIGRAELAEALGRIAEHARAVRQAKRELTEANLRLVVSVAKRYASPTLPLLDLIQDGNLGLLKAVDRFQYRRGFKFSTYATWWIRQAITRALAEQSRTIRIPTHLVEARNRIARVHRDLAEELGREVLPEELAERTGVAAAKIRLILESFREPLSLETPIAQEATLADVLQDTSVEGPTAVVMAQDLTTRVQRALATLAPREQAILRLRFGFDGGSEHTLEEIGKRFAVTRERIRQLEGRALGKLRQPQLARNLRAFVGTETSRWDS
ncbi:MAG: sigma-70 family RNA polymerase sigma factor [Candidatus Rokubacteria bacterium]|nr:sigma-70 family RNA polymerase sigma factor [Candidatus Rokubacteria bacterium]